MTFNGNTPSYRERICQALEDLFKTMNAKKPVDDPLGVSFSVVSRTNIEKLKPGKISAIGIYDGSERKTHKTYPTTDVSLIVMLEVHIYIGADIVNTTELNKYMTAVERRLYEDQTLGGLCYDIVLNGSELTLDSMFDRQVSGVMEIEVRYRHRTGDPRKRINE